MTIRNVWYNIIRISPALIETCDDPRPRPFSTYRTFIGRHTLKIGINEPLTGRKNQVRENPTTQNSSFLFSEPIFPASALPLASQRRSRLCRAWRAVRLRRLHRPMAHSRPCAAHARHRAFTSVNKAKCLRHGQSNREDGAIDIDRCSEMGLGEALAKGHLVI